MGSEMCIRDRRSAARLEELGVRLDPRAAHWERGLARLEAFAAREGHADVPQAHREGDDRFALGEWLHNQRRAFKAGLLAAERARRLEAAGATWDLVAARWELHAELLEAFAAREGHARVARAHVVEPCGAPLGAWLEAQRARHRKGKLGARRAARLAAAGVEWEPRRAPVSYTHLTLPTTPYV